MARAASRLARFIWILLSLTAAGQQTVPPPVNARTDVAVRMRDGVTLRADVYRPPDDQKHAVLLSRTPYDKQFAGSICEQIAARGFVCIVQDVRGRFASDGDWYPFQNEANDGYDTVEWAAALPYSNGKVGMFNGSYVGATQWLAALAHPPHLVALQPWVTASNYYEGWVYQGGALQQWFDQCWTAALAADNLERLTDRESFPLGLFPQRPRKLLVALSAIKNDKLAPYYSDWLLHPSYDSYWKSWAIDEHYSEFNQAVLNVGGWYDVFRDGTIRNFVGMRHHGGNDWARQHARLVIGPWLHGVMSSKTGDLEFGASSVVDSTELMLDWYDEVLNGKPAKGNPEKPVHIFVMGTNQWRNEDDWPLARTKYTNYYFHSKHGANRASGDGGLSPDRPKRESADIYSYDPSDPVPTVGGNMCCRDDLRASGPFDQREVEARNDVLVYTTPVLEQNLEVTGPIVAETYVSSSALDTDITAKLVDVYPDGRAFNITDGILRLRYRDSAELPELLRPDQIYKVKVDLGSTSNVFMAGHRLRLEISSSNYPHFDRNLNVASSPESGGPLVKATNRIYHDAAHPSSLLLPIIPN